MIINGVRMKGSIDGHYYGTTVAEPYNVGKHHFKPSFRSIYVSGEMYPGTPKSFFYVTSDIHGRMRLYRHKEWFDTDVGNIFASGKTLNEAVSKFENNLRHLIYNKSRMNPAKYVGVTDKAGTRWGAMPFGTEGLVIGRQDGKPIKYVSPHISGMGVVSVKNPRRKRRRSKMNLFPILVIAGSVAVIYWLSKPQ